MNLLSAGGLKRGSNTRLTSLRGRFWQANDLPGASVGIVLVFSLSGIFGGGDGRSRRFARANIACARADECLGGNSFHQLV